MIKKSLASVTLFVFAAPASLSSMTSLNINSQQAISIKKLSLPNQKIVLNVELQSQGSRNCFCTCVEGIFRFFGMTHARDGTNYSIDYIYEQIAFGIPELSLDFHADYTFYMNQEFSDNRVSQRYWQLEIPANFGVSEYDMMFFQLHIMSAMRHGAPVILNTRHRTTGHAIVINGIELVGENPNQTIYYYQDPAHVNNPVQLQFTGAEIRNFFTRGNGYIMGPNINFDFRDRNIGITLGAQTFLGSLQDNTIERNQAVDLTKEAGITTLSQLKEFKTIKMNNFMIETIWFEKSSQFRNETWKTKNLIAGKSTYKKHNPFSWFTKYNNVARGQFDTYYAASTWTEDDGNFYLNLSYQFYAQVLLTTTLIYADIKLGTQWILSFD